MLMRITNGKIELYGIKKTSVPSKIVKILLKHKEMTISQIQEELTKQGDKYNYRTIWQHVNSMKGLLFILEKKEHETGKPVSVKLTEDFKDKEVLFKKIEDIQ